jgi:hypothetical protein
MHCVNTLAKAAYRLDPTLSLAIVIEINGCPYTGNIFTIKTELQCTQIFFTIKTVIISFFCLISDFFNDTNLHFSSQKLIKILYRFTFSLGFFSLYCYQDISPAAPSAALATPRRPHLSTAGAPVAAARVAAHWRSSPLVVVVGSGAAPPL